MFKWYINEKFSLKVLKNKIAVLIYGFLLYLLPFQVSVQIFFMTAC